MGVTKGGGPGHGCHNAVTLGDDSSTPSVPGSLHSPFTPHKPRLAGGGEFGEVYKAKWHGSYVAAKVLKRSDEIALGDFRTEIAILRKIHHPNCVQVCVCVCGRGEKRLGAGRAGGHGRHTPGQMPPWQQCHNAHRWPTNDVAPLLPLALSSWARAPSRSPTSCSPS